MKKIIIGNRKREVYELLKTLFTIAIALVATLFMVAVILFIPFGIGYGISKIFVNGKINIYIGIVTTIIIDSIVIYYHYSNKNNKFPSA